MTPETFIEQELRLGRPMHQHDGVWWRRHGPFYWKPAIPYMRIPPGKARPARLKSFVGYSHGVPDGMTSNWVWPIVSLTWNSARKFTLEDLSANRRSKVRRGLKRFEIRPLDRLEPWREDLREINISTRKRTGVGKPITYYTEHQEEWWRSLCKLFALPDRQWWGAFMDGRLAAYYYTYQIDDTLSIDTAKSHSDFLRFYPNDALLFVVLQDALNTRGCRCIHHGGWTASDPSLLDFKLAYGFGREDIPVYLHVDLFAKWLLMFRRWFQSRTIRAEDIRGIQPADSQASAQ